MKSQLYFLAISVLVLYPIKQSFGAGIENPEDPTNILQFGTCEYPREGLVSTYVFQGPIVSNALDKQMDNYNEKKINLKISNFEYLLDPDKNITKGYISIYQPNASSFNNINIRDTYTMCTSYLDNKPSKDTLAYIAPLHDACMIKEINLKGTTHINPALKIASEPKEFKLQLSGIPDINTTAEAGMGTSDASASDEVGTGTGTEDLKEIKGILKIGSTVATINDIVMDISCIDS